jgi:hypothetical protein
MTGEVGPRRRARRRTVGVRVCCCQSADAGLSGSAVSGESGDAGLSTAAAVSGAGAGLSGLAGLLTDTGLAGDTGSGLAGEAEAWVTVREPVVFEGLDPDDALLVERASSGEAGEAGLAALAGEPALWPTAASDPLTSSAVARMICVPSPGIADALAAGTSWTPGPMDSTPRPIPPATPRAPTPSARVPVMTIHFLVSFISSSCSGARFGHVAGPGLYLSVRPGDEMSRRSR